jgi:hypothetical protein
MTDKDRQPAPDDEWVRRLSGDSLSTESRSSDPGSDDDKAELEALSTLLADPGLWAEPPADLEDRVVARIAAEARSPGVVRDLDHARELRDGHAPSSAGGARPSRAGHGHEAAVRRHWRPGFLVAAAAGIAAVAVGAWLLFRSVAPQAQFTVALTATELAPGASGSVSMVRTDSGWDIQLTASGLPRLDGGQFYQAWLRNADGILVPIGTFNGGNDVRLWAGVSPADFPTFTVTQEAADGDQASSGQRVLVGTAAED